jgi:signal transduction histidine kinase
MAGFNRLHLRIMLPFVGLIVAVGGISLLLSRHALDRLMDRRLEAQSQRISRVLANAQFVFNPIYLNKLRDAIDSDIVVLAQDSTVKATTLDRDTLGRIVEGVNPLRLFEALAANPTAAVQRTVKLDKQPLLITARRLSDPADNERQLMLWVIADMGDATALLSAFTARILLVGAGGILLVLILGHLIARSVSRPVDNLVSVTGEIADGRFDRQARLPAVTELRGLAEAVNTMSRKLAEYRDQVALSSRLAAAGKITAAMAHEIKNPLSSIKMLTQLLRDRLDETPDNQEIVGSILEEIVRLERILGDMANRLRPSGLKTAETDINALIHQSVELIRPKLRHRKIDISSNCHNDVPRVWLDPDKIKQVLWNLLLNAMESMPAGGAVIVRTHLTDAGKICICVEDRGDGIPEDRQDRLFDPFFTTKPEGLGLGLSTSRDIIAAHGGTLTRENRATAGSRAKIVLPIKPKEIHADG